MDPIGPVRAVYARLIEVRLDSDKLLDGKGPAELVNHTHFFVPVCYLLGEEELPTTCILCRATSLLRLVDRLSG